MASAIGPIPSTEPGSVRQQQQRSFNRRTCLLVQGTGPAGGLPSGRAGLGVNWFLRADSPWTPRHEADRRVSVRFRLPRTGPGVGRSARGPLRHSFCHTAGRISVITRIRPGLPALPAEPPQSQLRPAGSCAAVPPDLDYPRHPHPSPRPLPHCAF